MSSSELVTKWMTTTHALKYIQANINKIVCIIIENEGREEFIIIDDVFKKPSTDSNGDMPYIAYIRKKDIKGIIKEVSKNSAPHKKLEVVEFIKGEETNEKHIRLFYC